MGTISDSFGEAYRNFNIDGVPSSGAYEPDKADIRAIGPVIEAAIANMGLGTMVGVTYATRSALNADLAHDAGTIGLVYADSTDANNDLYVKVGASGSGSWTNTGALHDIIGALAGPYTDAAAASAAAAAVSASNLTASNYGITLDGSGAGIWDLRFWKRNLFQDAAATVPVTAAGQPVGCIRNILGDTSWDLIQATNAARPTFQILDGVPAVVGANGTAMYSRAQKTLKLPFYLLMAMRKADQGANPLFGFYADNTPGGYDQFAFAADTFSTMRTNLRFFTAGRTWVIPKTSIYASRVGTSFVLDSLAIVGSVDCRLNGGAQTSGRSPISNNVQAADSAPGYVNLNCLGAARTPNPAQGFVFYGGIAAPSVPTNRALAVSTFRSQIEPVITSTDKVILIVGDSTGNDIDEAVTDYGTEPFRKWVLDAGATGLATLNPTKDIFYRNWGLESGLWCGWEKVATGSAGGGAGNRIFVANASVGGSQPSYGLGSLFAAMYGGLDHVDEIILNHGQNMFVTSATDPNGWLRAGEFMDAIDKFRRVFPKAPWLMIRTYPIGIPGDTRIDPVVAAVDRVAAFYGDITTVDVYTAFNSAGRPLSYYAPDKLHLSEPDGVDAFYAVFGPAYAAWTRPAVVAPAAMGFAANLLPNGRFDDFDGAVPTGFTFTASGDGTIKRSSLRIDAESTEGPTGSASTSVRMRQTTGSSYLQFAIDATPYRGKAVVMAVRLYREPGGSNDGGRLEMFSNGTGAVSNFRYDQSGQGQPVSGWVWKYLYIPPVPNDATTLTGRVYAAASGIGDVSVSRIVLATGAAGTTPRPRNER